MTSLGRYRMGHVLGSGAFATVWKAYDPQLDAVVAIKVLADNWSLDADVRGRFLTEARLLRRIENPRIVRVHDVGIAEERPYFVMDYVDGGTLAEQIGHVSPIEALRLAAEASYAVQALHDAGVVHRDIKPSNLLVDRTVEPPRVVVADLGSAKLLADASGITVTTGTPAYMAPEQAGRPGGFDGRADVYALAVVTHELITGRRPFADLSGPPLTVRSRDALPEPLAGRYGLQPEIDAVLGAALNPDPGRRPRDAQTFGAALGAAAAGTSTGARSRREWPLALVVVAAVAAFAVATLLTWLLR